MTAPDLADFDTSGGGVGLLASCLEMSRGGKPSSCNRILPPQNIRGLQKEIIQKGKISFSVWFLSNGRSEIFLDKWDSDHCPSRCGSVCRLRACACVQACVCTDVAFPPCKTSPRNLQSGGPNCKQGERCCPLPKNNSNLPD